MPTASTIVAFAGASLALLFIPGPAVIYILNRSVADGRRVGLAAVAGLEIGNLVHVLAAALGLSAVLAASATAFTVVKWIGVGYLLFVGVSTLLTKAGSLKADQPSISVKRAFVQGIVINTLNPKVALFFLSFLPQFINVHAAHPGLQALILGLVFIGLACITDPLYAIAASTLRGVLLRGTAYPFVQRYVAGTVFLALGLVAATASPSHQK